MMIPRTRVRTHHNDSLDISDAGIKSLRIGLGDTNQAVLDVQSSLRSTDLKMLGLLDGLEHADDNHEALHRSVESMSGWLQRVQNQVECAAGDMPDLRRSFGEAEVRIQALQANLQRTDDTVNHDVRSSLDCFGSQIKGLDSSMQASRSELQALKVGCEFQSKLLQETRSIADTNCVSATNVQRSLEALAGREHERAMAVESLKAKSARAQNSLEALLKDAAFLRQKSDHHDSVVQNLQQNHATLHVGQESLQGAHQKVTQDVDALALDLRGTRQGLDDVRGSVGKLDDLALGLRGGLTQLSGTLSAGLKRVGGLEAQHAALSEVSQKTGGSVAELVLEHRRSITNADGLSHELGKTNEALAATRSQLELAHSRLADLGGEIGRTNDNVQKLDTGIELCHAGFAGLQKGFVETGSLIVSRPLILPKLSREDRREPPGHDRPLMTLLTARGAMESPKELRMPLSPHLPAEPKDARMPITARGAWALRSSAEDESTHLSQSTKIRGNTFLSDA
mmetsp:Transcript_76346/g.247076  ORF Transcript_76346/g.247076 Transcript_76346/m.247076 type:complete len:511 (-) Transcript_76346:273-1805(-)